MSKDIEFGRTEFDFTGQVMKVMALERTVAQQAAVIKEQKETIASLESTIKTCDELSRLSRIKRDEQSALIAQQVELIEKLAEVLKCVDGGHTEPGWLGEMGKIEMWRVDEAISDYNQWKE